MNGILIAMGKVRLRKILFSSGIIRTRFDIPVLRLFREDTENFYTGPGISVPAVNDLLTDAYMQLVSESPYYLKKIVLRYSGFEIDVVRDQNGDQQVFQIGFGNQNPSAGVDVTLQENIIAFMSFAA